MDKEFEKRFEQHQYERDILEALLYNSMTDKSLELPTIKEFILSEVINGTIDYAGGETGKVSYSRFRDYSFENGLNKYFRGELEKHGEKLDSRIKKAIEDMTKCEWIIVSEPGDNYPTCDLYRYFKGFAGSGGICPVSSISSFSLPIKQIKDIKTKVLPQFSEDEIKDIKGISRVMRKYIDQDLEYIKKTYHW